MDHKRFNELMGECTERMKALAMSKSEEYSNHADKLENFIDAATLDHSDPLQALWGMWMKHVVSIAKFMREHREGKRRPLSQWREKLGDDRVYSVLAEAILLEEEECERARLMQTQSVMSNPSCCQAKYSRTNGAEVEYSLNDGRPL
jgi:hypothetical protein